MFHARGPTFWELARQALSSTERGYDLLAPKFDFTPFRTPGFLIASTFASLANDPRPGDGVDLCCGTGAGTKPLRELCSGRVVGLDMSAGMLQTARENLSGAAIDWMQGDVFESSFDQAFDLAVCFGALGHILPRDEERFLTVVHRALRPGGRFATVTSYPPPWFSLGRALSVGFNAAMTIRNALIRPPFIMYYLTFLLPAIRHKMERVGFDVEERALWPAYPSLRLVVATRRG